MDNHKSCRGLERTERTECSKALPSVLCSDRKSLWTERREGRKVRVDTTICPARADDELEKAPTKKLMMREAPLPAARALPGLPVLPVKKASDASSRTGSCTHAHPVRSSPNAVRLKFRQNTRSAVVVGMGMGIGPRFKNRGPMSGTRLELVTSTMSTWRSNQLS